LLLSSIKTHLEVVWLLVLRIGLFYKQVKRACEDKVYSLRDREEKWSS